MRQQLVPLVASAIAVLLQVVVAPIIPIMSVYPNFIVSFVIVLTIIRGIDSTYIYAFVLGLISDLLCNTPIGVTPFILCVIAFVLPRIFEVLDKQTIIMPIISIVACLFAYELVVSIVFAILGYGSFIDLFVQRVLLLTLYNSLIGCIYYLLLDRFSLNQVMSSDDWTISNTRHYQ